MKEPRGVDLLATLIDLLADQEGVKITYDITTRRSESDGMARNASCDQCTWGEDRSA